MSKRLAKRDQGSKKTSPRRINPGRNKLKSNFNKEGDVKRRKSRHQLAKERKAKAEREERLNRKKADEANMNTELAGVEGLGVLATAHIYIPIEKKQRTKLRVCELEEGTVDTDDEEILDLISKQNSLIKEQEASKAAEKTKAAQQVSVDKPQDNEAKEVADVAEGIVPDQQAAEQEVKEKDEGSVSDPLETLEIDLLQEELDPRDEQISQLTEDKEQIQEELRKLRQRIKEQDRKVETLTNEALKQKDLLKERQQDFNERLSQRTKKLEQIHLQELKEKMEIRRKEAKAEVRDELEELQDQIAKLKKAQETKESEDPDLTATLLSVNKDLEDEIEQMKIMIEESKSNMIEVINSKLQFVQKATAEIGRLHQELDKSRSTVAELQRELRSSRKPDFDNAQSARRAPNTPKNDNYMRRSQSARTSYSEENTYI